MNKVILQDIFEKWCKETKRSGGVLVGSSIREFIVHAQQIIDKEDIKNVKDEIQKR